MYLVPCELHDRLISLVSWDECVEEQCRAAHDCLNPRRDLPLSHRRRRRPLPGSFPLTFGARRGLHARVALGPCLRLQWLAQRRVSPLSTRPSPIWRDAAGGRLI